MTQTNHCVSYAVADTFRKRLFGLMGQRHPDPLLLQSCNHIHTCFMRVPIDVYYLDQDYRVVDVETGVKPWRICKKRSNAMHVLESGAGQWSHQIGDCIPLENKKHPN